MQELDKPLAGRRILSIWDLAVTAAKDGSIADFRMAYFSGLNLSTLVWTCFATQATRRLQHAGITVGPKRDAGARGL